MVYMTDVILASLLVVTVMPQNVPSFMNKTRDKIFSQSKIPETSPETASTRVSNFAWFLNTRSFALGDRTETRGCRAHIASYTLWVDLRPRSN